VLRNEGFVEHIEIWAYLAKCDSSCIGVIAFYECFAIYAGGVFGEISEFHVPIDYRSRGISYRLLNAALIKPCYLVGFAWKKAPLQQMKCQI